MTQSKEFRGSVRVAARIIDLLSSGLYPNPAACLKELINNAYDADATLVEVFVKPDADQIVIWDNGKGFTQHVFKEHFENVSESKKREDGEETESGREKIGMIGIGFIAANELCEEVEVYSTCEGSKELMRVSLNFAEMSRPPEERKGDDGKYKKADYEGEILQDAKEEEHYTALYLKRVKGEAKKILTSAFASTSNDEENKSTDWSLYGLLPETIRKKLADKKLERWEQFDFYSKTMVQIALNIPVQYHKNWHPSLDETSSLKKITKIEKDRKFSVYYDGVELRKPIVLRDDRKYISDEFSFEGEHVSAKGYFFASHGTISPRDLQGLLLRIKGSAVGSYHRDFLGFPQSQQTLFQNWTTCEIYASGGLEKAMNIDRATFRDTHPAFIELRSAIHEQLRQFLSRVRDELHTAKRDERREIKRKESLDHIKEVSTKSISRSSPELAQQITEKWTDPSISQRKILRTYSAAEILEMVSEVARSILPKASYEKLIRKLNERFFNDGGN